jgi:hypothetical protein
MGLVYSLTPHGKCRLSQCIFNINFKTYCQYCKICSLGLSNSTFRNLSYRKFPIRKYKNITHVKTYVY